MTKLEDCIQTLRMAAPASIVGDDLRFAADELERLQGDIQYALDRLANPEDQAVGLRELIDAATGEGDSFPPCELKRQKEQIHEINRHFGDFQKFNAEVLADVKRLRALLPPISKLQRMFTSWRVADVPRVYMEPMRELFAKAAEAEGK